jgi:imidazolonepropionase-like amidohydrolase
MRPIWVVCALAAAAHAHPEVTVSEKLVALTHVRVVDGTGAPARPDQTIVIRDGVIEAVGHMPPPKGARVIALDGRTVIPGLVGMHDHLFMTSFRFPGRGEAIWLTEVAVSAPRLYLASGVTTIRTTGSLEPYADLELKRLIDDGQTPGPRIFATAPYLEGPNQVFPQMHTLTGPDDARRLVEYWADLGMTSFKAYMHITREELAAAIAAAHARKLKVTGHLCTIGFRDAAALGIDGLEHGFVVDSELIPGRKGDTCEEGDALGKALRALDPASPQVSELFADLVQHHVAVTSTLPVFEGRYAPAVAPRVLELLAPDARESLLRAKVRLSARTEWRDLVQADTAKEMQLERAFVKAGGTLLAGSDPTGIGGVLAGLADQRELELLVAAGFTPLEAIHIATQNGAVELGEGARLGTIAAGKRADLVVVRGDPSTKIDDIENVELVFKDGVGWDPQKLLEPIRGRVGLQ